MDARELLADVADLGPFFALGTGEAEAGPADPVPDRVAHIATALGCTQRVAASVAFQGFAAHLVSAPFAAAVLHGTVPDLTPASVWWGRSADGGWVPRTGATALLPADRLPGVLEELLAPLVAAVRAEAAVSGRVLWGNAASALAAAKRLLVLQRPATAARAATTAAAVLAHGAFAGTGELLPPRDPDRVWTFRRRSCCLYYRVPGSGGLCDDCVLPRAPG
ncbi:(2Fe-2S)-binding protein [Pseudonocardia zijingensis]|uniref:(2Fe-2S)-binding protein n=1 Tax=Pseudonocardia zijingensis TaxID=153376 RepID=UPI00361E931C